MGYAGVDRRGHRGSVTHAGSIRPIAAGHDVDGGAACRHAWISRAPQRRAAGSECPPRRRGASAVRGRRNAGGDRSGGRTHTRARSADRESVRGTHALGLQVRRQFLRKVAAYAEPVLPVSSAPIRALRRSPRHEAPPYGSAWDPGELQRRALSVRALQEAERREGVGVPASHASGDASIRASWLRMSSIDHPTDDFLRVRASVAHFTVISTAHGPPGLMGSVSFVPGDAVWIARASRGQS